MKSPEKSHSSSDLNFEKVWLLFQETDRKFTEYREESRRLEKTIFQIQKETRDIIASFTDEIGEISKVLIEPPLPKLFNERTIGVQQTLSTCIFSKK